MPKPNVFRCDGQRNRPEAVRGAAAAALLLVLCGLFAAAAMGEERPHLLLAQGGDDAKIYFWTDENGVKRFSNMPPPREVRRFESKEELPYQPAPPRPIRRPEAEEDSKDFVTRVIVRKNRVMVPVTLKYLGRTVATHLILDTGASKTVLYRGLADELYLQPSEFAKGRVADGRIVQVGMANLGSIQIGPHKVKDFQAHILEREGVSDVGRGLLGMDLLREFDYQINFERQTITWRK